MQNQYFFNIWFRLESVAVNKEQQPGNLQDHILKL